MSIADENMRRHRMHCRQTNVCACTHTPISTNIQSVSRQSPSLFESIFLFSTSFVLIFFFFSKKFGTSRLVAHISVVTSSSAPNLLWLESLFVPLSNDIPFVRMMHLWDDQHLWEEREVPRRCAKFFSNWKTVYSSLGSDSIVLNEPNTKFPVFLKACCSPPGYSRGGNNWSECLSECPWFPS